MVNLLQKIHSLEADSQKLLCLIAYHSDEVTQVMLKSYAAKNNLKKSVVKQHLENLQREGMCDISYSYYMATSTYIISAIYFIPVLEYMMQEHEEWVTEFEKYHIKDRTVTMVRYLRDAVLSLLAGHHMMLKPMKDIFDGRQLMMYLLPVAWNPQLYPLLSLLPNMLQVDYFMLVLSEMMAADIVDETDMISQLLASYKQLSLGEREEIGEAIALYRYYAFGEYKPLGKGASVFDCIQRGVQALHEQKFDEADTMLQQALKMRNKVSNIKNIFINAITCYFLIALYVKNPTEAHSKKLQQFVNKREVLDNLSLWCAYIIAKWQLDEMHKVDKNFLKQFYIYSSQYDKYTYKAMSLFLMKVFGVDMSEDVDFSYVPKLAILQHEFQDYLPLDESRRKELNEKFGKPVLFAEKPQSQWEIVLDDLMKENLSPTVSIGNVKEKRLVYIINFDNVTIREQTRKKNGDWYAGKELTWSRYGTGDLDSMDEVDREICRVHQHSLYHLKTDTVLPYLIGSDRVFTGYLAPFYSVSVEEEKPYLLIDKNSEGFTVSSNLPELDGRSVYVVKKDDYHYHILKVSKEESFFYKRLLLLKRLPLEAEAKLKEVLHAIGAKIRVQSPLLVEDDRLETVESSARVILQIRPGSHNLFEIRLYVKPGEHFDDEFEPGNGLDVVLCKNAEGQLFKVKRNLKAEEQNLLEINTYVNSLHGNVDLFGQIPQEHKREMTLGIGDTLAVMEYAQNHSDSYAIEWPEGEKIHVKSVTKMQQWHLNLRQKAGWFDIEGKVELDQQTMMDISQLLQLANFSNKQNYIRLNETDYVLLTKAMRKQLAQLENLSTQGKGNIRVSKANAQLLDDALKGEIAVENSDMLKDTLKKINGSYNLRPAQPRGLMATLRDYQVEGYRWMFRLDSWGAGACLADDMGLGKTVQTIALLLKKAKDGPSLVVAPTSVITNWKNEMSRFSPSLKTVLLNEEDSQQRVADVEKAGASDVILTTYGIVCSEAEMLKGKEWNVICLDEAHTIKNRETKTAQAVYELNGHTRIALTGTPIQNHLGELWSLFNFINPGMLGSYDIFRERFVMPIENGDKDRQHLLRRIVLPFILRRTKQEVVKELPDKTEIEIHVDLSAEEMHTYEHIRMNAKKQLEKDRKVSMNVLAEITRLRQAACASSLVDTALDFQSSKLEQMLQLVNEIREGNNRILIFSQFTSFLKMVKEHLDKVNQNYLYLDGTTTMKQRENLVQCFQRGDCGIFIISLKAGGLGLNLTGANYVIHMDPWWNPAIEQQATDRAYRIGQEQKVTVYHLIASHTIEEKILRLHQTKRDLADSLLAGADVSHKLTEEDLQELLS